MEMEMQMEMETVWLRLGVGLRSSVDEAQGGILYPVGVQMMLHMM